MVHLRLLRLWRGHRGALALLVAIGVAISLAWAVQALLLSRLFAALLAGSAPTAPELLPSLVLLGGGPLGRSGAGLEIAPTAWDL